MSEKKTTKGALFTSVVAMLLCLVMLIGTTFAWFTGSVVNTGNQVQSARFQVKTAVSSQAGPLTREEDGTFLLDRDQVYTVALTAGGDASTGYCKILVGEKEYRTAQLAPGQTMTFTIDCTAAQTRLTVIAAWGTGSAAATGGDLREAGEDRTITVSS